MLDTDIFLVYIVLGIIYTIILIYTIIRLFNTKFFKPHWGDAKYLYYFQIVQLLIRSISFWVICVFGNLEIFDELQISFILMSLPEDLIISCYIVLFWIMLTANLLLRFDSNIDYSLAPGGGKTSLKRFQKTAKFFLISWIALDIVMYVLVFFKKIRPIDVVIQHSVLCFFVSLIVLVSIVIVQIKYSGIPYISDKAQKVMKRVLVVVVVWSFGRIAHGIMYLIREKTYLEESSNLGGTDSDSLSSTVILIFDLLINEIICFLAVNEFSFFEIFSSEFDDYPKLPLIEPLTPLNLTTPKMDLFIKESDLTIEEEFSVDPHKLGKLYRGYYRNNEVLIRKIYLQRLNNYVKENIYEDLANLSSICCPHYLTPLGVSIHGENIDLVIPYLRYGSLFEALRNNRLVYIEKLRISREIAFCLKIFHDLDQVHGHLTSFNILLDSSDTVCISDLGLVHLKKFCGITSGYVNKSAWSSPQLLNEAGSVASKVNKSDDVYSFGVIFWEIITDEVPFPDIPLKQLQKMLNEGFRPGIPKNIDPDIGELLKSCWNIEPGRRPTMELVHNTICLILARERGMGSFFSAEGF